MSEWLKEDPVGVLVASEPDEFSGMVYHVWFPYARAYMAEIKEGSFVVVRSFSSAEGRPVYSVLEIVSVLPTHYALGTSAADVERAFPGFVVEAAKSAKQDWEQTTPEEETTKIKAEAIPTGLQVSFQGGSPHLSADESLPMMGESANLLSNEMIDRIVNGGLADPAVQAIRPCTLVLNRDISVCISTQDLLRTHFGVFGFTGSGKSNLVSTVVDRLLESGAPIKVVLFDLMSEYIPLLIDDLDRFERAYILSLDTDSLPGGATTLGYLTGSGGLDNAVASISRTMLLPVQLVPHREQFSACIRRLLEKRKIRIYDPGAQPPSGEKLAEDMRRCIKGNLGNARQPIDAWIAERLESIPGRRFSDAEIGSLSGELQRYIRAERMPDSFEGGAQSAAPEMGGLQPVRAGHSSEDVVINPTAKGVLNTIMRGLQIIQNRAEERPPAEVQMPPEEIFRLLHDPSGSALIVVQCDRDDELRGYVSEIINRVFHHRRLSGVNQPPVLFIFDEADEFIPQGRQEDESYALSRAAAAILARRGRKFGMGMAIATQRVAYLDTSIMAQPHTYLVSKLPRKYDRETMAGAFGITDDMMRKSLKFTKGQWLLVSYDATGLVNVPIPVQFPNANDRILEYLSGRR